MNGAHDVGGLASFAPIDPAEDPAPFHHAWQRRMFALVMVTVRMQVWNVDQFRFAIESIPPPRYYGNDYFANWLEAVEQLVVANGLCTVDELRAGAAPGPAKAVPHVVSKEEVSGWFAPPRPRSAPATQPRFHLGQRVRARNLYRAGHTRLPRYVRGKTGVVAALRGEFPYPDQPFVQGAPPLMQHCYTVVFTGDELWGEGSPANQEISIEAWEDYLEPA